MAYKSPISVNFDDLKFQITEDFEKNVVKAVQSYKVDVNREELLQALNYDRKQYEKGYKDGRPVHVFIKNKYSDYPVDGFWDKQRNILYTSFMTAELATQRGYSWEEIKEGEGNDNG